MPKLAYSPITLHIRGETEAPFAQYLSPAGIWGANGDRTIAGRSTVILALTVTKHRLLTRENMQNDEFRLGQEAKIRLPNVDEVLDKGYALHAADDPALLDTEAQKDARHIIEEFRALQPRTDTEAAYLSAARGIVLAYGRAISRRKQQWSQSLEAARVEREQAIEQMRDSTNQKAWLVTFIWKIMPMIVLVLTGIAVTQTSNYLPEDATKILTWIISLVVGGIFALIGRLIGTRLRDLRRNALEVRYNAQLFRAHILYEEGKASELRYYRTRMCEAWKQYTGDEFPRTASYAMVMAGDIETRKEIERQRLSYGNRTTLWLMRRLARLLRGRRKGESDEETPPSPQTSARSASSVS